MISFLIQLLVIVVVLALIFRYLIPMIPYPINVIVQVVLVLCVIVWLLQVFIFGGGVTLAEGINYSKYVFV